jgi:hypothetical protein
VHVARIFLLQLRRIFAVIAADFRLSCGRQLTTGGKIEKSMTKHSRWGTAVRALVATASLLAISSASAAVVWQFNPNNQNAPVGSPVLTLTSQGFQLTVAGRDNDGNAQNALHQLYFKSEQPVGGATEVGLGLVNTNSNEFNAGPNGPLNYLQLDLRNLLAQGFFNGQVAVASLQNGEGFRLFGSNVAGQLGVAIGGPFMGLAFDNQFVSIPNFGAFQFVSIAAAAGNVLPVAFRAEPIPELSALLPIVALLAVIAASTWLRRRRAAQLTA